MKKKKLTPQEYNGAENLAFRLRDFFNHQANKAANSSNPYCKLEELCWRSANSAVMCELAHMLLEVGAELEDMEEHFRANHQLEV